MRESQLYAQLEEHLGLEFEFERSADVAVLELEPVALCAVPATLRLTLERALVALDVQAIGEIGANDAAIAASLAAIAAEFQYDRILRLLHAADAGNQREVS